MTPEQLDTLLDNANRGAFLAPSDPSAGYDARAAAASDLAAMRQPITAEALLADGWEGDKDYKPVSGECVYWLNRPYRTCQVMMIVAGGATAVYVGTRWMQGVSTMYDLRELVRLLGGEP